MKKSKIAIIAHCCRTGGGLGGTLNWLKAIKDVVKNEQFLVVYPAGYGYEDIELPVDSQVFIYKGRHSPIERYWFERFTLPKIIGSYKPDVVFGAANTGLIKPSVPQLLLVQQAYLFYDEKYYPDINLKLWLRIVELRSQIKKTLSATDLILCQTAVAKRRFSQVFNYPEDKVKILRWATPDDIDPKTVLEPPSIFDAPSKNFYVFMPTRYMPHRNPHILIQICKLYGEQIRAKKIKFITTVEAAHGLRARKFLKDISKNHLEDIIINVGNISREEISTYFSCSHLLWLPTTLETLGLPFLEAMKMGIPILAPDIDFARYVCGNAAVFYDPWKIESIFDMLILLRDDPALRNELIDKGKIQLLDRSRFAENWEEVATDLMQYIKLLIKHR